MEDMKTQINYKLEKTKTEINNTMPYVTDPTQKLQYSNEILDDIYNIGLIKKDVKICNNIIDYWEKQKVLQEQIIELQDKMTNNMENIIGNVKREL